MSKRTPAAWLVGTWRSDKRRTVEGWGKYPPEPAAFRKLFVPDLGKMTVTYGRKRSHTKFRAVSYSGPYRVVWQSDDAAFVVRGDKKEGETGQLVNFKTPDLYWVHCGRFLEYFSRVKKPNNALKGRRAKRARP